jgi:hypothetical protein
VNVISDWLEGTSSHHRRMAAVPRIGSENGG